MIKESILISIQLIRLVLRPILWVKINWIINCVPWLIFNGNQASIRGSIPLDLSLYTRKTLSSTSINWILYGALTCLVNPFAIRAVLVLVARKVDILSK